MKYTALVVALLSALISGCAVTPGSPVQELARQDVRNAHRVGFIAGMVTQHALDHFGVDRRVGVAARIAGHQLGAYVGRMAARRRIKYVQEQDFLQAEIADSHRAVAAKKNEISGLQNDLQSTRSDIAELEKRHRENEDVSYEAARDLEDVNGQIGRNQTQMVAYKKAIVYMDEVLSSSRRQSQSTGGLESKRAQLVVQRDQLQSTLRRLEDLDEQYKSQRSRLQPLARGASTSASPYRRTYGPQSFF